MFSGPSSKKRATGSAKSDDEGFASAQFIGLMALSIAIIATFVNIFTIEYLRSASFSAVREAARAGTQVVDLGQATESGDADLAIEACEESLESSAKDLFSADPSDYTYSCEILEDNSVTPGRFSMKASMQPKGVYVVPWAVVAKVRLKNISATYEQRQKANPSSPDDEDVPVCDPDDEDCAP